MKRFKFLVAFLLLVNLLPASTTVAQESVPTPDFKIEFEKFKLDNGLEVVFHIDRSDPVVAVALTAHVGSAREKTGRTGFAHLFEHLLFLESENLGKGGLDKMSARIGGSGANGSTSRDRTNYFQTVPNDALEKMLWAEADKLGWFINTVTDPVLAKEKQVVKNEKRQSVDNNPYGHNFYVIDKALYPEDHPYNWQVIGSLEDLQNATLADVKEFFRRWYVTNNVTLVVAGDFDPAQAKKWVKKYFDEIKPGQEVMPLKKRAGVAQKTTKLYHEDNFATVPQLTMVWPTAEQYHPDSYPLAVLTQYLSQGKNAPLYKVLVEEKKLTAGVNMFDRASELAGQTYLLVRNFDGKDLDDTHAAVKEAFEKFEAEGISGKDLGRIKAGQETQFYNGLSSVLGKGFQLAQYNIFAGDPGYVETDIKNILAVTTEDVMRVYEKYIKDKNYIATSFVPKSQLPLALEGSTKADVVEEKIVQGAEEEVDASIKADYERTPSTFDRTKEPPYGTAPEIRTPEIWEATLKRGLRLYGIENSEVPLVDFNIVIEGGQLQDDVGKAGVANFTARMMTQGTKNRTPRELEEAIEQLGASINVSAQTESIRITGNTLARNYDETIALLNEIVLKPRWDEKEFELVKKSIVNQIRQQQANPVAVAQNNFSSLVYSKDDIRSRNILGSIESVESITMKDLKSFYKKNISQSVARMHVVGALGKEEVIQPLNRLSNKWKNRKVRIAEAPSPAPPAQSKVFFYDIPDAKQSVVIIGYPALAESDEDFYPATVANYILGGGGFASQLTQQLREGKGYTYGIFSNFAGSKRGGSFSIFSRVRSNVTLESLQLIKKIVEEYPDGFTGKDLETTKGFLIKSAARAFETSGAKLNMLEDISTYGWRYDYVKRRESVVRGMTVEKIRELSKKYIDSGRMYWLVVGDAKTQLERMKELGFGEPVWLNEEKSGE
ncbi:MAG: insulinase family protein [Acidobacteriota bacterium]|nr:insulinase family protein [Acidobacteriota bacterium]